MVINTLRSMLTFLKVSGLISPKVPFFAPPSLSLYLRQYMGVLLCMYVYIYIYIYKILLITSTFDAW